MLNCLDTTQKDALNHICNNPVVKIPISRFDIFSEYSDFIYKLFSERWGQVIEMARSIDSERLTYSKKSYGASCNETGARLDTKGSKWLHMFQFGYDIYCAYFEDTKYGMVYIICK